MDVAVGYISTNYQLNFLQHTFNTYLISDSAVLRKNSFKEKWFIQFTSCHNQSPSNLLSEGYASVNNSVG